MKVVESTDKAHEICKRIKTKYPTTWIQQENGSWTCDKYPDLELPDTSIESDLRNGFVREVNINNGWENY